MKIIEKPTYKSRTDFFFIFSGEDLSKGLDLVDLMTSLQYVIILILYMHHLIMEK
jgi:hypothetical protein